MAYIFFRLILNIYNGREVYNTYTYVV